MSLMREVLNEEKEVVKIWRSCRGGISPAMDFLHYIGDKGITLGLLMSCIDADATNLVDYMKQCIERNTVEALISRLPNGELEEIASVLSVKERPQNRNLQFTWKDVAGRVGLTMTEIDALDAPCQTRENTSITEEFIQYLKTSDPNFPVVLLKNCLHKIQRNDVVSECKIFARCKKDDCFQ